MQTAEIFASESIMPNRRFAGRICCCRSGASLLFRELVGRSKHPLFSVWARSALDDIIATALGSKRRISSLKKAALP